MESGRESKERRGLNMIWTAASDYGFTPLFVSYDRYNEPDLYFNTIMGLCYRSFPADEVNEYLLGLQRGLFGALLVDIFWLAPVMGLLIFGVLLPGLDRNLRGSLNSGNAPCMLDLSRKAAWVLVCCFVVVILRSCLGLLFQFLWKTGGWSLVLICAVVFGKAAGGFLGDWLGLRRGAMVSL